MPKPFRRRVYLFLTRNEGAARQILVRSRVVPRSGSGLGSGVETPGGTVEPGEEPADAASREAREETGLTRFGTPRLLAEDDWEGSDERLRRFFFQVPVVEATAGRWTHHDEAEGVDHGVAFLLRWVDLPGAGDLDPHFRAYVERVERVEVPIDREGNA